MLYVRTTGTPTSPHRCYIGITENMSIYPISTGSQTHGNCFHLHFYLYLNRGGRRSTTGNFTTCFLHVSLFSTALLGLGELQACPFSNVVVRPLPLSAWTSFPPSLCLARWFRPDLMNRSMSVPLQFASLYDRQEVLVWSNCLLDLDTDFLVGNTVFV